MCDQNHILVIVFGFFKIQDDEPESSELLESQEEMPPLEYVSLPTEDHSASESQPKQEKAEQVHVSNLLAKMTLNVDNLTQVLLIINCYSIL